MCVGKILDFEHLNGNTNFPCQCSSTEQMFVTAHSLYCRFILNNVSNVYFFPILHFPEHQILALI